VAKTLLKTATLVPSPSSMAARRPDKPAPTTTTSYWCSIADSLLKIRLLVELTNFENENDADARIWSERLIRSFLQLRKSP
jgi:hypothetical protein